MKRINPDYLKFFSMEDKGEEENTEISDYAQGHIAFVSGEDCPFNKDSEPERYWEWMRGYSTARYRTNNPPDVKQTDVDDMFISNF